MCEGTTEDVVVDVGTVLEPRDRPGLRSCACVARCGAEGFREAPTSPQGRVEYELLSMAVYFVSGFYGNIRLD